MSKRNILQVGTGAARPQKSKLTRLASRHRLNEPGLSHVTWQFFRATFLRIVGSLFIAGIKAGLALHG